VIRVVDDLPAGLAFAGVDGDGWQCLATGQRVTCTRSAPLAPEEVADDIAIDVEVLRTAVPAGQATAPIRNDATVATAGDARSSNDTDGVTAPAASGPDLAASLRPPQAPTGRSASARPHVRRDGAQRRSAPRPPARPPWWRGSATA
jgi:hypothetical protein